LTVAYETM